MKKLTILFIGILLLFVGCSADSGISSVNNNFEGKEIVEDSTSSSYSIEYEQLSGTVEREVKISGSSVNVNVVSESGKADLYITDENGDIKYQGNRIDSISFVLNCEKNKKYSIKIIAENHKGSFSFEW